MTNPYNGQLPPAYRKPEPEPVHPQYGQLPPAYQPQSQSVVTAQPAPTVALTVIITLLFGIFGLIPAATGSSKAAALGLPTGKYWGAFFGVMGTWIVLVLLLAAGGA